MGERQLSQSQLDAIKEELEKTQERRVALDEHEAQLFQALEHVRAGMQHIRIQAGDAEVRIPPVQNLVIPDEGIPKLEIQAPSPIGPIGAEIEQGDTFTSVLLMLAQTTGLLIQAIVGMWAFFYFKKRYSVS
jgi:hypothetical protein